MCKGCFSRRLTEMSRNAKTKTKNNAQCFYNLHNLCHKSSFIYRCFSYMAKQLILALLYLIIHCRPRFLSTLMRVICFAQMTHGFLLNCPTVKIGGGGACAPSRPIHLWIGETLNCGELCPSNNDKLHFLMSLCA